jgi:hypothetical protein
MKKFRKTTVIHLARSNHARCPIYEHEGKYYIKTNRPNTMPYSPFRFENELYAEVKYLPCINGEEYWYTV